MPEFLESVDHFADRGKVEAGCGHRIDVRKLVFVHQMSKGREVGTDTMCPDCAAIFPNYVHPSDARKAGSE